MLPKQLSELASQFIKVYDTEHSFTIEFRKAHNAALAETPKGFNAGPTNVILIGKRLIVFLDFRIVFICEKYKDLIKSIGIEPYAELNQDLKLQIAVHYNDARLRAETFLEEMRTTYNAPTGYTVETKQAFQNLLNRTNAEIDQFCAVHHAEKTKKKDAAMDNLFSTLNDIKNIQAGKGSSSGSHDTTKSISAKPTMTSENEPKHKIHWIPDAILAKYPKAEEFIIHAACFAAGALIVLFLFETFIIPGKDAAIKNVETQRETYKGQLDDAQRQLSEPARQKLTSDLHASQDKNAELEKENAKLKADNSLDMTVRLVITNAESGSIQINPIGSLDITESWGNTTSSYRDEAFRITPIDSETVESPYVIAPKQAREFKFHLGSDKRLLFERGAAKLACTVYTYSGSQSLTQHIQFNHDELTKTKLIFKF